MSLNFLAMADTAVAAVAALEAPIAVLLGGESAERDVSLQSGAAVLAAMSRLGVEARAIDTAEADWQVQLQGCAAAFLALHGGAGEDGTIQGALQMAGVPYTGSGVLASALAMDKLRCKQMWQGSGVPTPAFAGLSEDSDWQAIIDQLGGVAMVKPAAEGSSFGLSKVDSATSLQAAFKAAAEFDSNVLAEQWVNGPEYTVALLDGKALPAIGLETDAEFYDYEAKYLSNETRYLCPCGLAADDEAEMAALAEQAFASVGASAWGRVDVMRDAASGQFYLLEVNTVPGMTDHSLVPMAAKAAGLSFDQLIAVILSLSGVLSTEGELDA